MARKKNGLELRVEGTDDKWTIINLMMAHGFDPNTNPRFPEVIIEGSVEELLANTSIALESTVKTIGFVLDANSSIDARWNSIRSHINKKNSSPISNDLPVDGLIGEYSSPSSATRFGVWIMPNNQDMGKLEDFLKELIDEEDDLIRFAESCTDDLLEKKARFKEKDREKAVLHSWLAWQENPGCPYGTAINNHYLKADKPAGQKFAAWFKELYQL